MTVRYDIPENGSFTATYSSDQTQYAIFDSRGNKICTFNVDYQKERPVHEYVYPNHVSYIEVSPNFTKHDRLVDSALGTLNIAIIPTVLSMPNITPHICRHTYCSNMAKAGMNPKTLQYLMGHSDIGVTLNTYTHFGLDDASDEMKRMEEMEKAQKEMEKTVEEPRVTQKLFRVI